MNLISKRIRGMQDVLPNESVRWEMVERVMKEEASLYGFKYIRTPVLEQTELFERSAGESSDVVNKEMYTFTDKGGRSVTLRPEGTAGVLRAVLENGMHNDALPLKLMYVTSCYRYEKPQSGRLREFFQFGLEIFGGNSAMADAEIISVSKAIFERLGIRNISLEINAIGCPECKESYNQAVKEYFKERKDSLCSTCLERLERNPLRIFDCKNESCKALHKDAPVTLQYLCKDCAEHLEKLKYYLDAAEIDYIINPRIVRGLDYYTKTVFEFVTNVDGSPLTVCGGGRYDELSKQMGGPKLSAIGMGLGMERLLMVMEKQGIEFEERKPCEIYIAPMGESAKLMAIDMCRKLRSASIYCELDLVGRNIKSQMKYADKTKVKYCIVLGSQEVEDKKAKLKNMATGEEFDIELGENFLENFMKQYINIENRMNLL